MAMEGSYVQTKYMIQSYSKKLSGVQRIVHSSLLTELGVGRNSPFGNQDT